MLKDFLCLPLTAILMMAAGPDEALPELRIQIMSIGGGGGSKYLASLERIEDRRTIGLADMALNGVLRFCDVPYGEYRLTLVGGDGTLVYQQRIAVNSLTSAVVLNLPARTTWRPGSGTVSVFQLQHPIPKKALPLFRASKDLFARGDYQGAAHELEKAIRAVPRYAEAYTCLAAMHIKLGLYEQALNESAEAMNIVGPNARDLSNMALADYDLARFADSAETARQALRLDSNYDPAHFVLGVALAIDRRSMPESVPQ